MEFQGESEESDLVLSSPLQVEQAGLQVALCGRAKVLFYSISRVEAPPELGDNAEGLIVETLCPESLPCADFIMYN